MKAALGSILLLAAATSQAAESEVRVGGGTIHLSVEGQPDDEAALRRWVEDSAGGVTAYLGRFPVPDVFLGVRVGPGGRINSGVTRGGRRPSIRIRAGRSADAAAFRADWVLTHEMLHLAFPDLTTNDSWAEEGLSTYAEPWARARQGLVSAEEVWAGLVEGVVNAAPGSVTTGLHGTRDWGRTYWGGALFWLLADVEIRERTGGRSGLPDALRGILAAGGDIRVDWTLARALAAGDRAVGGHTLTALYDRLGAAPGRVDLDDLWRRLGVRRAGRRVTFDDGAPLAAVRKAISGGR